MNVTAEIVENVKNQVAAIDNNPGNITQIVSGTVELVNGTLEAIVNGTDELFKEDSVIYEPIDVIFQGPLRNTGSGDANSNIVANNPIIDLLHNFINQIQEYSQDSQGNDPPSSEPSHSPPQPFNFQNGQNQNDQDQHSNGHNPAPISSIIHKFKL